MVGGGAAAEWLGARHGCQAGALESPCSGGPPRVVLAEQLPQQVHARLAEAVPVAGAARLALCPLTLSNQASAAL